MQPEPDVLSTTNDSAEQPEKASYGVHDLLRHFSPAERLALYILSAILGFSAFVLITQVNAEVSTRVPAPGGHFVEGGVGTPRFVNPLLATTPVDQDLAMLTYSGLLRLAPDGSFVPDLASSYEISDDGTTYTFHLREELVFHDGTPLTADDVLYTISLAQNPDIKSPRRANWEGVVAEAPNEHTVVFKLPHAYAPFLENATLGIVPKELWERVSAEEFPFHGLNTHPIGSGPYEATDVTLDATGAPEEYSLRSFEYFALGTPNITSITYRAYPNEDALAHAATENMVDSFVISSPKTASSALREDEHFMRIPLTRVFGVFFNQNHTPVLADTAVRRALGAAIDKERLVADVLGGFGSPLSGPLPRAEKTADLSSSSTSFGGTENARNILSQGGWKYQEGSEGVPGRWVKGERVLSVSLSTADAEELVQSAEKISEAWGALGVDVDLHVYPLQELNQTVLRPRSYDVILFGEVIGRSLDLYPFWHSSQRNDPGLNLSLYANAEADRTLAEARTTSDGRERQRLIDEFVQRMMLDIPAVFLYAPEIAYVAPRVSGIEIGEVTTASERFAGIHSWYRDTERVWDIFE